MKCVNCGKEDVEDLGNNKYYCSDCDLSFATKKGRVEVAKKGRIETLEETVKEIKQKMTGLTTPAKKDDDGELF